MFRTRAVATETHRNPEQWKKNCIYRGNRYMPCDTQRTVGY